MGGEQREELSDGSYLTITNITNLSATSDSPLPDDGVLKMDLGIHQTYISIVLSRDESGNPRVRQEREESHIRVPTLVLPGNMIRSAYSSALHKWLHSLHLDYPLDDDLVWDFTFQVLDSVFERIDLLHQNVAMCVSADLHRAPIPIDKDDDEEEEEYEPMEDDDEEEEEDDPMDDEEEDDPIMEDEEDEYDPIMEDEEEEDEGESLIKGYRAKRLTDLYAVVAAEEHCRFGDCLICLDPLLFVDEEEEEEEGNKGLFGAPCGHYFHKECMSEWLMTSVSCPLCRFDISSVVQQ